MQRGRKEAECSKCKGKGKIPCLMCRGKGTLKRKNPEYSKRPSATCPYCQGSSFECNVKCKMCGGTGKKQSSASSGALTITVLTFACPMCGGDGKGPPVCGRCRGAGVVGSDKRPVICTGCFGTGRLFSPCRGCRGQGWVRTK